jgi:hypothetical protein
VPTTGLSVTLMTRQVLAALTLASTFTMPPGYQSAVTLTLAEHCAAAFGTQPKPSTIVLARQARPDRRRWDGWKLGEPACP